MMVPKSDRWTQMNRPLVDNNSTESCTHNVNPILIRKNCSLGSLADVSDCKSNRRDKPNIIMKHPNISFNLAG
jgi:hypothetical protein